MVKRIVWTHKANLVFRKILEFYISRNKSPLFSRKLNREIHLLLGLLAKQPFLGLKTDIENVRVFIRGNYKIFYLIEDEQLVVLLIWDTRQNPETFSF